MDIVLLILFFLIGISVGSFLNVVADRVPRKQSIVSPPSHCFSCGHVLTWKDMVPVISYIMLKGKCRYCHASIMPRSMIIELVTGVLFILAWLHSSAGIQLLVTIIYTALFIVLIIADLEKQEMPLIFIYCVIIMAVLLAAAHAFNRAGPDLTGSIVGLVTGFGLLALVWLIFKWCGKGTLGFRNVLVGGMIGASIGYPAVIPAIVFAFLIGAVFTVTVWIIRKRKPDRVPLAAILCCAALIIIYTGGNIVDRICSFGIF